MSNKGYGFEIEVLKYFRELEDGTDKKSFRIYGSGRNKLAKNMDPNAELEGDVLAKLPFLNCDIQVECKHYKPSKSSKEEKGISVKKEWLDQNREEAENSNRYSVVAIKYKGQRYNAVQYIMPREHFENLLLEIKYAGKYIKELLSKESGTLKDYSTEQILEEIKERCQNKNKEN